MWHFIGHGQKLRTEIFGTQQRQHLQKWNPRYMYKLMICIILILTTIILSNLYALIFRNDFFSFMGQLFFPRFFFHFLPSRVHFIKCFMTSLLHYDEIDRYNKLWSFTKNLANTSVFRQFIQFWWNAGQRKNVYWALFEV